MNESQPDLLYQVVKNHEEQYSIWPLDKDLPLGWESCSFEGSKKDCLAHIDVVWTDMRPLSLRKLMAEQSSSDQKETLEPAALTSEPSLVERLCIGDHPITIELRPSKTIESLNKALDRQFVQITFIKTQGGTTLGFNIDIDDCDLSQLTKETGNISITGSLELNFEKVRCKANINISTFEGLGHLELINA
jgi:uncharacterized protein YbdZ (MbtH family)